MSGTREAELTKLLENTFRHVNIALVNELAMFAAELGIDVWEAIDAATTKPFGYLRFTPGPGVGGPLPPHRPQLPLVEGPAHARPAVPLRRAGQRRQRAHARLRGPPAAAWPSTGWAGRSTGPGSCCSDWPTSATPATPVRLPARSSPRPWPPSGPRCGWSTPTSRATLCPIPWSSSPPRSSSSAHGVVLVTDHDAFDYELVRRHAQLRPGHPESIERPDRRTVVVSAGAASEPATHGDRDGRARRIGRPGDNRVDRP